MFKRMSVTCACVSALSTASVASADSIVSFAEGSVTWQATGVTTYRSTHDLRLPIAPIGTPYTLTFNFNPGAAYATSIGSTAVPNCLTVDATGSFQIGGTSFGLVGHGYTHAQAFGGSLCVGSTGGFTEFAFWLPTIDESPWDTGFIFLVASYVDQLMPDAFPATPTGRGALDIQAPFSPAVIWAVGGPFVPAAIDVEQPMPVPEPATLTMFGAGLAALVARRRRRQHH